MIVGISVLGFSIGYTLDAVGPIVVASMLSIFVFKEIRKPRQLMLFEAQSTQGHAAVAQIGPSRARPHFAEILGPEVHELPRQLRMHPELIGEVVEVINSSSDGEQTWLHLHESFGALRLRECDVRHRQEQHGVFFMEPSARSRCRKTPIRRRPQCAS